MIKRKTGLKRKTGIKKRTEPIRKISPQHAKELPVYSNLRKLYLLDNNECKGQIEGVCTFYATDIHHMEGRGKNLLNVDTWIPLCRACHDWVGDHPEEANIRGLLRFRVRKNT